MEDIHAYIDLAIYVEADVEDIHAYIGRDIYVEADVEDIYAYIDRDIYVEADVDIHVYIDRDIYETQSRHKQALPNILGVWDCLRQFLSRGNILVALETVWELHLNTDKHD